MPLYKVIFDVERGSDLLWCLARQHFGHRPAGEIEQWLDVEKVGDSD